MLKWLRAIFKKKKQKPIINPCSKCIWWAAEEENRISKDDDFVLRQHKKHNKFCDMHKIFTNENYSCSEYVKELFEATPTSTQTEEMVFNHELLIDGNDENDIRIEKR